MSRIGKVPVEIPAGVKISRDHDTVSVEGPKGRLSLEVPKGIDVILGERVVEVKRPSDGRKERSYHGLVRTLIANMVKGVSSGFEKSLKLVVGFSAPIEYAIPDGIQIRVDKLVNIAVSGIDKQVVGRVAAEIRSLKKPEPYKGKGIKYTGEHIRRKVGKSVGA
jgi:large subunit ribosomal protein L6